MEMKVGQNSKMDLCIWFSKPGRGMPITEFNIFWDTLTTEEKYDLMCMDLTK